MSPRPAIFFAMGISLIGAGIAAAAFRASMLNAHFGEHPNAGAIQWALLGSIALAICLLPGIWMSAKRGSRLLTAGGAVIAGVTPVVAAGLYIAHGV